MCEYKSSKNQTFTIKFMFLAKGVVNSNIVNRRINVILLEGAKHFLLSFVHMQLHNHFWGEENKWDLSYNNQLIILNLFISEPGGSSECCSHCGQCFLES